MDVRNLLELSYLYNTDSNDTSFNQYLQHKVVYKERNLSLEKTKLDLTTMMSLNLIAERMVTAQEHLNNNKDVKWFVKFEQKEQELNLNGKVNVIFIHHPSVKNDIMKKHTYLIIVYCPTKDECYVINHLPIEEEDQNYILSLIKKKPPFTIHYAFDRVSPQSCIINMELDILRVMMAIYLVQFDRFLKVKDNESIDFVKGFLEYDNDLKERYALHKQMIRDNDNKIPTKAILFFEQLNVHIAKQMMKLNVIWSFNSKFKKVPFASMLDYESRQLIYKYPLDEVLTRQLESFQHPPSPPPPKKDIIDKIIDRDARILSPIMNDDYVKRDANDDIPLDRVDTPSKKKKTTKLKSRVEEGYLSLEDEEGY